MGSPQCRTSAMGSTTSSRSVFSSSLLTKSPRSGYSGVAAGAIVSGAPFRKFTRIDGGRRVCVCARGFGAHEGKAGKIKQLAGDTEKREKVHVQLLS